MMKPFVNAYGFALKILPVFFFLTCFFSEPALPSPAIEKTKLSLAAGICLNKAQVLTDTGRVEEAIDTLKAFIRNPKHIKSRQAEHPYLHFFLGNCYLMHSRDKKGGHTLQKAAQSYRTAIKSDPSYRAAWLNLAKCCYEMEAFPAAAQAFESAWKYSDEKKATHLYYAAVCHFQARENEKALEIFTRLMNHHPKEITLSWKETYVNILFSMEKYKIALPYLQELAHKSPAPRQAKWQEILLQHYLNLEMDQEALFLANELTRSDPLEAKWWKGLSHIHLKENRLEKGLAALVIYGFLTPMTEAELSLAADLYLALDVPGKAVSHYATVFEQNHDPKTLEKLTQALVMAYHPDEAMQWIEKGLVMMEKAEAHLTLLLAKARLLYMNKSWEDAATAYKTAARYSKQPGHAWLMSGYALLNCEKVAPAENAFQKAAGFKKQKTEAMAAIKQVKALKTQTPKRINTLP